MQSNFWVNAKGKRETTKEINKLLTKFIGRKVNPVNELFASMKKVVIKYFKQNPNKLKYFMDSSPGSDPFDFSFEIEENSGVVINAYFQG